jgi:hypothetical protein
MLIERGHAQIFDYGWGLCLTLFDLIDAEAKRHDRIKR